MPATFSSLRPLTSIFAAVFTAAICHAEEVPADAFPGAHQRTPSLSEYASWINNTNESPTEEQVLVNLDFFQWLHDEYGMVLDIYNISAGTIDKAGRYGSMDSKEFRRNFPNGFGPIYEKAKRMDTRLATWGGPDGFGDTPEEEKARIDMMVKLCRDYEFILLKFDAVVGPLRPEKQDAFARIFNIARKHREILVDGMVLPENGYGEKAVACGDGKTRLITLRNVGWEPVTRQIRLDEEIGLTEGSEIELRQLHPTERVIGTFKKGEVVEVEVVPFRACLLHASSATPDFGLTGCDYEVVRDVPGKPVRVKLLAMPGEKHDIKLLASGRKFRSATLDGKPAAGLLDGGVNTVSFPGEALREPFHRKLGELAPVPVPADAEALYEATCFAADNNAFEVRELKRSGPTAILQVQKARDAFFKQPLFIDRGVWDRNLFDGDDSTAFYIARRVGVQPINRGSLRIDLGEVTKLDKLLVRAGSEHALQPFKHDETIRAAVSRDLKSWTPMLLAAGAEIVMEFDPGTEIRYVRFEGTPDKIVEIEGFRGVEALDRTKWRASQLFASGARAAAAKAWQHSFKLNEIPEGSYLAIALNGSHGEEGAYAALRVNGKPVGAPNRAVSYPANSWENPPQRKASNYTYYIPLTPEMKGQEIDAVVLGMRGGSADFKPEVWITAYPAPLRERLLTLNE